MTVPPSLQHLQRCLAAPVPGQSRGGLCGHTAHGCECERRERPRERKLPGCKRWGEQAPAPRARGTWAGCVGASQDGSCLPLALVQQRGARAGTGRAQLLSLGLGTCLGVKERNI